MAIWSNGKFTKGQVEMESWWNGWWNDKLMKFQIGEITSWQNGELTKWRVDEKRLHQNKGERWDCFNPWDLVEVFLDKFWGHCHRGSISSYDHLTIILKAGFA